jgi:hypothetical protein
MNTATPRARGTAISNARNEVARVPKMNGSAPKSPLTGSHDWLVKNLNPNSARLNFERRTRIVAMKITIAKILQAHNSITPANVRSAILPLPRLARNLRISEGGSTAACTWPVAGEEGIWTESARGTVVGSEEFGSELVVIWVRDTDFPGMPTQPPSNEGAKKHERNMKYRLHGSLKATRASR